MTQLSTAPMHDYFRPNFFANTPDILPEILQHGGRAAFCMRAVLGATLAPTYGIYSGFELCENAALPGKEEYLNSEKYEIRVRDWNAPGNIRDLIRTLNLIRRENVALQELGNILFLPSTNDNILFYAKRRADNILLIAVNLDPFNAQEATVTVPPEVAGISPGGRIDVVDLLTGAAYNWGQNNYVRLDPMWQAAHILRVHPRS